eukprot:CAMPEP_0197033518 /NCGR_PEP_ID=MMETSP1384-20130603/11904_1 /TAXON_ID=29189 /ORGANISM="Ammonia sp." /LENGTH=72 /DNA_ID=CAMNT_0042463333 /DNA_START=8 /DNA_END=222 /DNA_ORIENTATION=+
MTSSEQAVGVVSVLALGYTLVLVGIHMYIPHPDISRSIIRLSFTSLVFSVVALGCIACTYFTPFIQLDVDSV